jgi:hypothetical protein
MTSYELLKDTYRVIDLREFIMDGRSIHGKVGFHCPLDENGMNA